MIKKLFLMAFAVITLAGAVTGCRTAEGAGQDIENAGQAIQDTAEDLK